MMLDSTLALVVGFMQYSPIKQLGAKEPNTSSSDAV